MPRKVIIKILIIFQLIKTIEPNAETKQSRLNVVLVIFDDLRPAISSYGDNLAQTPHLDRFMNDSFYFTRAYSQQSLCAPSRNSMLTSRRPDTLRLYDFYNYWRTFVGNFTTLPQYFKEHGYRTFSIGKVFHPGVSSNQTDDYPISWSQQPFRPKTEKFMNSQVCPDGSGMLRKNLICPVHLSTQPHKTLPDIESVSEAIRILNKSEQNRKEGKPFFLALGFHKPHINFRFPKEFFSRFRIEDFFNYTEDTYKPQGMPNVAWNPFTDVRSRDDFKYQNISFPYGPIPGERQRAAIRQAYYASVAYVDELFGRFIAAVNRENTIVLVTGDHGWSLGEHAEWAKYSNFEVALRVPIIIRTPEIRLNQARKLDDLVELVDVFPTLVDLAHLPSLSKCKDLDENGSNEDKKKLTCTEGKSLYSLISSLESNASTVHLDNSFALSQYPRPGWLPTQNPNSDKPKLQNIKVMGYSMRTKDFRYTLWVRFHPNNFTKDWSTVFGEEIYDHRIDSGEFMNLVERPEIHDIRKWLRQKLILAFS